jgi:catechol 2,3-dioxygenase-like lactoylglutathione lyase family enzyme
MPFDQQITFLYTRDLAASAHFYGELLGLPLVLDQGLCRIYRVSGDAFLGICQRDGVELQPATVIVTFVLADAAAVDARHAELAGRGVRFEQAPALNATYNIYHCFLRDPSGYLLEIQAFLDAAWPQATVQVAPE